MSKTRGRSPAPRTKTVTSRGFTGQGTNAAEATFTGRRGSFRRRASPCSRLPSGCRERGATPTRSARTPLVMRPWYRRLERPALATIPPREPPAPAKGRSSRAPGRLAHARPPAKALRCTPGDERPAMHGGPPLAMCRLRGHTRGQGRITRSSAKKIGICCTRGAFHRRTGFASDAAETAPDGDPSRTSPLDGRGFSTDCYQPVENARRLLQSRWIHHP
jgi:hypothetical protein